MADYGPSLTALRLFEKTSAKGNTYLTGRWGNLRVAVMKSQDVSESGEPIWSLRLSEAPPRDASPERATKSAPNPEHVKRDHQRPPARTGLAVEGVDEEIPF